LSGHFFFGAGQKNLSPTSNLWNGIDLPTVIRDYERSLIETALRQTGGNQPKLDDYSACAFKRCA